MSKYIDGFVVPIPREHLEEYQKVALQVGAIWREYGAIEYCEWLGDDMILEGTKSFHKILDLSEADVVVFGWVVFPSKDVRDKAKRAVPNDPRMEGLVGPLTNPTRVVFDASQMFYGRFKQFV